MGVIGVVVSGGLNAQPSGWRRFSGQLWLSASAGKLLLPGNYGPAYPAFRLKPQATAKTRLESSHVQQDSPADERGRAARAFRGHAGTRQAFRQRRADQGAIPGRPRTGGIRLGVLLGRRAQVLAAAGRLQ